MPIREILRAVIFLHRPKDKQDFNEVVTCIPDSRMKDLEEGLLEREDAGLICTVQIGRYRMQAANFTDYVDGVDKFFDRVDKTRLHSSKDRASASEAKDDSSILSGASKFTGFDDIEDIQVTDR